MRELLFFEGDAMTIVRIVNGPQQFHSGKGVEVRGLDVDRRVRAYMSQHAEKSYGAALAAVAKSQPDAVREYAAVNRDEHRGDSFDPKYRSRMEKGDSSSG